MFCGQTSKYLGTQFDKVHLTSLSLMSGSSPGPGGPHSLDHLDQVSVTQQDWVWVLGLALDVSLSCWSWLGWVQWAGFTVWFCLGAGEPGASEAEPGAAEGERAAVQEAAERASRSGSSAHLPQER